MVAWIDTGCRVAPSKPPMIHDSRATCFAVLEAGPMFAKPGLGLFRWEVIRNGSAPLLMCELWIAGLQNAAIDEH